VQCVHHRRAHTPIDAYKRPELGALEAASRSVGRAIARGRVVVYESTVYPGVTEEVCIPIIERESGLKLDQDFSAGYSPERINPGDQVHRLENIVKITSGSSPAAADFIDWLYARIITAGTHKVSSIRDAGVDAIRAFGKQGAVLFDVKRALPRGAVDDGL